MATAERGPEAAVASGGVDVNAVDTVANLVLRLEQALLLDDPTRNVGKTEVALARR
jgi:hypothetical protein